MIVVTYLSIIQTCSILGKTLMVSKLLDILNVKTQSPLWHLDLKVQLLRGGVLVFKYKLNICLCLLDIITKAEPVKCFFHRVLNVFCYRFIS